MEPVEMEAMLLKHMNPIRDRLLKLEAETGQMKNGKPSSGPLPSSTTSDQVEARHGLCEDQACESCVAQGQELVEAAFAQGQVAALENLDQWLIQAGGEAFRQKIIQLAAQGKEAYEQSQQTVKIVA